MRVEVWKCPKTKKLFEAKADYLRHRCDRRWARAQVRRRKDRLKRLDEAVAEMRYLTSFREIAAWVEANFQTLYLYQMARDPERCKWRMNKKRLDWKVPADFRVYEVEFERMRFEEMCSNSHAAPRGKPTNWGSKPDLPKGYPGWRGRINFRIDEGKSRDGFGGGSDLFNDTGINTGSGGGGGRYSYDVRVFAEDFLAMYTMKKLEGTLGVYDEF